MHDGKSFAANLVTLATDQNAFLAQVDRTALIIALESYFGRVQIFHAFARVVDSEAIVGGA